MYRQFPRHRYFRDLASAAHGEVEKLATPLLLTPHRDLRRFHQQKAQQHVALLADVSQSAPISAGLFRRNQTDVAGQSVCRSESAQEFRSPTRNANAVSGPTPGCVINRRVTGRFSISSSSARVSSWILGVS